MIGRNMRVFEIIDKRWDDQLHQPLHAAGHILNPGLFYTNNENKTLDLNVWKGYHACVAKLVPDEAMQDKIGQVLGVYMQADGILGLASAIRGRTKLAPGEQLFSIVLLFRALTFKLLTSEIILLQLNGGCNLVMKFQTCNNLLLEFKA